MIEKIIIWFLALLMLIPRVMWANIAYLTATSDEDAVPIVETLAATPRKKRKTVNPQVLILKAARGLQIEKTINIAVLIFTDGRKDCIFNTFNSFKENVTMGNTKARLVIVDDSNDPSYSSWLTTVFGDDVDYIKHNPKRLGFGGTIKDTWAGLEKIVGNYDYVFHLEDDFIFNQPLNMVDLIQILKANPHLAQVSLLRQPWNENEIKAGGIWQQFPDKFKQEQIEGESGKIYYLSHKEWFTTNPSLYPKWVVSLGWPKGQDSEEKFWNKKLKANQLIAGAYFGSKTDPPAVTHIGFTQVGTGY